MRGRHRGNITQTLIIIIANVVKHIRHYICISVIIGPIIEIGVWMIVVLVIILLRWS
jgi:hypothetical protein